jgi:UDP-galactopyranose mutase
MYDVICVSHLRWNFVFQRPQHLLSRCAEGRRVLYVEEPVLVSGASYVEMSGEESRVRVAVPHIDETLSEPEAENVQAEMIQRLCREQKLQNYVLWYYTPMALPLTRGLEPRIIVYDCMDELSAFKGAPPALVERERQLFEEADLVFTGGRALYEVKRKQHHNVHAFPSSVDRAHFEQARRGLPDPQDQAGLPHPRLGFFGVIDERMDIGLLASVAKARPDWQLVMLGPVVKIDPADLPRLPNIHYLGSKSYAELPSYISGWDVALLPFAKNESTRFISPTKTPEYLAAGKPVVSTSIRDVVRPYSVRGLARIADTPRDFIAACESALRESRTNLIRRADAFLANMSWESTWAAMNTLIENELLRSDTSRSYDNLEAASYSERLVEVG